MSKREYYWIAITVVAAVLLYVMLAAPGADHLGNMSVSIHDTYFIFPSFFAMIALLIMVFFLVYFVRAAANRFRNRTLNWIFVGAAVLLVIMMLTVIYHLNKAFA